MLENTDRSGKTNFTLIWEDLLGCSADISQKKERKIVKRWIEQVERALLCEQAGFGGRIKFYPRFL